MKRILTAAFMLAALSGNAVAQAPQKLTSLDVTPEFEARIAADIKNNRDGERARKESISKFCGSVSLPWAMSDYSPEVLMQIKKVESGDRKACASLRTHLHQAFTQNAEERAGHAIESCHFGPTHATTLAQAYLSHLEGTKEIRKGTLMVPDAKEDLISSVTGGRKILSGFEREMRRKMARFHKSACKKLTREVRALMPAS